MPAVIIVDLQCGMLDGVALPALFEHERLIANTIRLADWARAAGVPVAYVRHDGPEGSVLAPGTPGWPIFPAVAPKDGEAIFGKSIGDAFSNPALAKWLAERAIDEVILAGAQTDQCVNDTCRGALARGLAVTIAADAHSTYDYDGEIADQIIARQNRDFVDLGARVEPVARLVE